MLVCRETSKKMNENDIKRINELYHKSKKEGLTDEEKKEQAALRKQYVESIRRNIRASLDNVSIVESDGSVTDLKDINKNRSKTKNKNKNMKKK